MKDRVMFLSEALHQLEQEASSAVSAIDTDGNTFAILEGQWVINIKSPVKVINQFSFEYKRVEVPFIDAAIAVGEGYEVECDRINKITGELATRRYMPVEAGGRLVDGEGQDVTIFEITTGKWYIVGHPE